MDIFGYLRIRRITPWDAPSHFVNRFQPPRHWITWKSLLFNLSSDHDQHYQLFIWILHYGWFLWFDERGVVCVCVWTDEALSLPGEHPVTVWTSSSASTLLAAISTAQTFKTLQVSQRWSQVKKKKRINNGTRPE